MSRGGLAGSVCCCDCPPERCRLDCMYVDLNYTATGTFTDTYSSSDCFDDDYETMSRNFSFIAIGQPGYILNRGGIGTPEWICTCPKSNPYSNGNISGGLSITGSGSYSSESVTYYFLGSERIRNVVTTDYTVTWSNLGSPNSNFLFVGSNEPGPNFSAYAWDIVNDDYNCDEEERCMILIPNGGVLNGAGSAFTPSIFPETLSVAYRQIRSGQTLVQEFDESGSIVYQETFPISDQNDYYFPYAHLHRILNNRVDCDDDIGSYELAQGNTEAMCFAMERALGIGYLPIGLPDLNYPETEVCEQGEQQAPHTRSAAGVDIYDTGPCVLSLPATVSRTQVIRATARSTIEDWGAANCPTP